MASRVYPRVGGETEPKGTRVKCLAGLSPRGRGNLVGVFDPVEGHGSIPAWAGKPRACRRSVRDLEVYPRVGGETKSVSAFGARSRGLSPRGRGNPRRQPDRGGRAGSIPAWAGKPRPCVMRPAGSTVYPRVGGETAALDTAVGIHAGLSPRGRGNRVAVGRLHASDGSIPAWAGKPVDLRNADVQGEVYPRVGGETCWSRSCSGSPSGLSPRGRGNRCRCSPATRRTGSIPAWAGKPASWSGSPIISTVYPRVGGETGTTQRSRLRPRGLSPRGRGNLFLMLPSSCGSRSIPAWAGKPYTQPDARAVTGVYPRVGGETINRHAQAHHFCGLSPRGRGNLCVIMTQFRKRMNMSKTDGPTETHLPYGESGAIRAARQVALDGAEPQ